MESFPDSPHDHESLAIFGTQPAPATRTLVDIFESTAAAHPDAAALVDSSETLTYREAAGRISALSTRFGELGIGRGSRIGIRVPSGTTDLYVAILATIFSGAAYVPVDWDDPDSRATTVWEEAAVDAVVGEGLGITVLNKKAHATHARPTPDDDAWIDRRDDRLRPALDG